MPFDGLFLSAVCRELSPAVGAKVDKIYQPTPNELVLAFRGPTFSGRLLLCVDPSAPRVHITNTRPDNPPQAPAFCMLMRKVLAGARLSAVKQMGSDRLVTFEFDATNEMGDAVTRSIVVELMGRCANVIVVENGRVLDALRRVDFSMSATRPILPGGRYEYPEAQPKKDITEIKAENIEEALSNNAQAKNALLSLISGLSPLLAREVLIKSGYQADAPSQAVNAQQVMTGVTWLKDKVKSTPCFTLLRDEAKGNFEFSFVDIEQYGSYVTKKTFDSAGALLDTYYEEKHRESMVQARGADLKKAVQTHTARLVRKMTALQAQLQENQDNETYCRYGNIITANIYRMKQGDRVLNAEDYERGGEVEIVLDENLSPSENAQRYYKKYRKAKTACEHLVIEMEKAAIDVAYLESVTEALGRAATGGEVAEIREELIEGGYIRQAGKRSKIQKTKPHRFVYDGVEIVAGRNNLQNEELTHRVARKNEWWFHRTEAPGSHVIVRAESASPEVITFAAEVAAYYSAGSQAGKTAVDMTRARYVKKIPSAGIGMVSYTNQTTLYVTPDAEKIEKYRKA